MITAERIASAAARAQAASEAAMTLEAVVTRPADSAALNETTGVLTPNPAAEVYDGPCRIGPASGGTESRVDTTLTVDDYRATFPMDAGPFQVGDLVAADGKVWRVTNLVDRAWGYDQMCQIEQVDDRG